MTNYNPLLTEIMHLASQAITSNDDAVKRIALGDIADAVARVIRGESAAVTEAERHEAATEEPATLGCPSLVPPRVIPHDEPAAEVPRKDDDLKRRQIQYWSFADGLFPIHTVRTPIGISGKCVIKGRKFTFSSVDESLPGQNRCSVKICDGDKQVAIMDIFRGRSMSEHMALGAFKKYIKRLSGGSKKFRSHGGFLKLAAMRLKEAQTNA